MTPLRTILIIILTVLISCTAMAVVVDQTFEPRLRKALRNNPTLVAEAVQGADVQVLGILEQAAAKRRQQEVRAQREAELKTRLRPTTPAERLLVGSAEAPITIVEFSDFQCPYCSRMADELAKAMVALGPQAKLYYKHYPLRQHKTAAMAAAIFEALRIQSRTAAEAFYKSAFRVQDRLDELGEAGLKAMAKATGVDMAKLEEDLRGPVVAQHLQDDAKEFASMNFDSVPVVIINGVSIRGMALAQDIVDVARMVGATPVAPIPATAPAAGAGVPGSGDDCLECLEKK